MAAAPLTDNGARTNIKYRRRRGLRFCCDCNNNNNLHTSWSSSSTSRMRFCVVYYVYYNNMCSPRLMDRVVYTVYSVTIIISSPGRCAAHTLARWPSRLPFFVGSPPCTPRDIHCARDVHTRVCVCVRARQ